MIKFAKSNQYANIMAFKMIVLDLDGTLTNSEKKITPKTKKALMKAQKSGVKVVLASGRPTFGIEPIARELEIDKYGGYVLSFNGGKIIDWKTKEVVFQQVLPAEKIPELYEESKRQKVAILSYNGDDIVTEDPEDIYVGEEAKINTMPIRGVDNFVEAVSEPVTKCLMVAEGSYLAEVEKKVQEKFGKELSIYRSQPFFLEIMAPGIDKAQSLNRLLDHLHMTKDEMIACGDGFNDLSMIELAKLGVAMNNAQDEVKKKANFITLNNDSDGVAYVVNNFIFKRNPIKKVFSKDYWKVKYYNRKMKK